MVDTFCIIMFILFFGTVFENGLLDQFTAMNEYTIKYNKMLAR